MPFSLQPKKLWLSLHTLKLQQGCLMIPARWDLPRLVGFLLSLHITKRDPDVQRRLRSGTWLARTAFALFALVVLGLFQAILSIFNEKS